MPSAKPLLSLACVCVLAGCQDRVASSGKARGNVSGAPAIDSIGGTLASAPTPPVAAPVDTPRKSTGAVAAKRTGPDSAIMLAVATQPKARSKNDSISLVAAIRAGLKSGAWPVPLPAPLPGSILPAKRIVAFYGNPLSKRMGILGEIPYAQMLTKLDSVVAEWRAADPTEPVLPALHLIASVAQGAPGKDSMYRQRSDPDLIEKIYGFAKARNAITILDIQTGRSTLQAEIPVLIPFLSRPDVELGIDPEFNMHYNREGRVPGTKIGAFDAKDVNYAIDQLAALVTKYHLPPKILIVHRFTTNMLQHADQIKHDPRVQVVINMDGWGQPWLKFDTYRSCEVAEPVQFTGFKLFFHNDTRKGDALLSPREVLALRPRPIYIQYQ
ncbi:MAG TPA: hypothetical protein VGM67_08705 [Gemmatimonadaceae bacterium]|jgi:hypothetical protein